MKYEHKLKSSDLANANFGVPCESEALNTRRSACLYINYKKKWWRWCILIPFAHKMCNVCVSGSVICIALCPSASSRNVHNRIYMCTVHAFYMASTIEAQCPSSTIFIKHWHTHTHTHSIQTCNILLILRAFRFHCSRKCIYFYLKRAQVVCFHSLLIEGFFLTLKKWLFLIHMWMQDLGLQLDCHHITTIPR